MSTFSSDYHRRLSQLYHLEIIMSQITIPSSFQALNSSQYSSPTPESSISNRHTNISQLAIIPLPVEIKERQGRYAVYSKNSHSAFVNWWSQTQWGQETQAMKHQHSDRSDRHDPSWGNPSRSKQPGSSDHWAHFDELADLTSGRPAVQCQHCAKILSHPTPARSGTNGMVRHLSGRDCMRKQPVDLDTGGQQTLSFRNHRVCDQLSHRIITLTGLQTSQRPLRECNMMNFQDALIELIADCHLPFRLVERASFRNLLRLLHSSINIPGRTKMTSLCAQKIPFIVDHIERSFPRSQRISLALDVWTSVHQQAFLGVNAYYIDQNWEFQEILIGFKPLTKQHTGSELAKVMLSLIQQYHLQNQLLAITTDNATNNMTLRKCLSDLMQQELKVKWNHEEGTIRCMAHVVQLSLGATFKSLKVYNELYDIEDQGDGIAITKGLSSDVSWSNTIRKVCGLSHIVITPLSYTC